MGNAESSPEEETTATEVEKQQAAEQEAAAKLQAIARGRKARLDNPLSRADAKLDDGSTTMRVKLTRKKTMFTGRTKKLGIELDADNCVVSLQPPASGSDLRVGDYILEIDGHELGVKLLVDVLEEFNLQKQQSNELRIRRPGPAAAAISI